MLASELVAKLNELIKKHGDLPVFNYDGSQELNNIEFFDECEDDCNCHLNENIWFCEEDHFINGFIITE